MLTSMTTMTSNYPKRKTFKCMPSATDCLQKTNICWRSSNIGLTQWQKKLMIDAKHEFNKGNEI